MEDGATRDSYFIFSPSGPHKRREEKRRREEATSLKRAEREIEKEGAELS